MYNWWHELIKKFFGEAALEQYLYSEKSPEMDLDNIRPFEIAVQTEFDKRFPGLWSLWQYTHAMGCIAPLHLDTFSALQANAVLHTLRALSNAFWESIKLLLGDNLPDEELEYSLRRNGSSIELCYWTMADEARYMQENVQPVGAITKQMARMAKKRNSLN